jgi:hypothetical protein
MRDAVAACVRSAEVGGSVGATFLERAVRDGLTVREYRIPDGDTVVCAAGPEDLVVVRLVGRFFDISDVELEVDVEDIEAATRVTLPRRPVVVDRDLGEVMLVFPGDVVRQYPRSRWTLRLHGRGNAGVSGRGPFVMDHWPTTPSEFPL